MAVQENINNVLATLAATLQTLKECEASLSEEIKETEQLKQEKEQLTTQLNDLYKELEEQTKVTEDLEANRLKFIETLEAEEAALLDKMQSIKAMAEKWTIPTVSKEQLPVRKEKEKAPEKKKETKETKPASETGSPKTARTDAASSETLFEKLQGQGRPSLNDKMEVKSDVADVALPIGDISKAISVSDRLLFIKEFFEGDDEIFQQAVEELNGLEDFASARSYIAKVVSHWDPNSEAAKLFLAIVRRRYL